jgi:hypothetical protein
MRHGPGPFSARSKRFVDVVARSDPKLADASIQGLNALAPVAEAAGIVLSALDLGITEMWDLVDKTAAWEPRLRRIENMNSEVAAAIDELRTLNQLRSSDKTSRLSSLKPKLNLFRFSANYRAVFGATTLGIDWEEVLSKKQAVLIDFSDIHNELEKRFCLLWIYNSFLTFVKNRGQGKMREPISFIIDELTFLVGTSLRNSDMMAADIDELVNRISRSHGIWVTLAVQELFQLPEQIRQTLLSVGTVIFGRTSDHEAAEDIARRYFRYDPYWKKKEGDRFGREWKTSRAHGEASLSDMSDRSTEFTKGEQNYFHSRKLLKLKKYHFFIGQSQHEGELPTSLQPFTIDRLDEGQYPERSRTDKLRSELMRRDGIFEETVLTEVAARLGTASSPPVAEPSATEPAEDTSVTPEKRERPPAPPKEPSAANPAESPPLPDPAEPGGIPPLRRPRSRKPPTKKP